MKINNLVFYLLMLTEFSAESQLIVDSDTVLEDMISDFFGPSVLSISNLEVTGGQYYRGTFNAENTNLGMDSGIILANGDIALAVGPNDMLEVGIFDGNGLPGDDDLTNIAGYETQDASVLEFDFVPASDTITFTYVFASEEYPEWVSFDVYNDVFALLLDGVNIALLPDASAVCVNNVNCFGSNVNSYWCNDPVTSKSSVHCDEDFNCPMTVEETTLQYDGLTVPLQAIMILTPGNTHHLKIGIADVSDNGADSGVFLSVDYSVPVISAVQAASANEVLQIFPNPNNGTFQYQLSDVVITQLNMFDQFGREIVSINPAEEKGAIELPTSASPGLYWLIAKTPLNELRIKILVLP